MKKILMAVNCFLLIKQSAAQNKTFPPSPSTRTKTDTTLSTTVDKTINYNYQRDLVDIGLIILHKNLQKRTQLADSENTKLHVSAAPILEYTLSTGFATGIAANGAFLTNKSTTNISSFLAAIKYTQKKQFLLPIQTSIWTKNNTYNLLGDWRFLDYPQDTYGIGGNTSTDNMSVIAYKYVRFYETVLKNIGHDFYAGLGYQLNHHWGISETDVPFGHITDFDLYGPNKTTTSSGLYLNLQYDSRKNSINPEGGAFYANVGFLQNFTFLGSNSNWNSIAIDVRKYLKMPGESVLAFWFYSMLTLAGNPPYLDLPGTGYDTYNNTGRGYEQGRFIGKRMIDLETEYRFKITRNGLVGGVVFANAESLSEWQTNAFKTIAPGFGAGLRIKINKFSNTNACIDYGIGRNGSRGFFGNLGEIF